jgi:tetratricopeptide (TPR) repeat protein
MSVSPTAPEASSRAASEAGSGRQVLVYLLVAVGAVVFLVFLPALSARAVFLDDTAYVADNPLVTNPGWHSVRRFFTEVLQPSSVRGYYQPLTMVSLMADYALAGPTGGLRAFHQTSLLLHVGNTALVIVLLYLLFGEPWVATGVGLLFGLHPLAVDSVCWLSERKTVLATFFALGSVIAYVRFVRTSRRRHALACLLLYVLALLSKPITVPLPVALLLLDGWPLRRLSRPAVVEKLPLLALAAVFAVVTYVSQGRTAPIILPGRYPVLHVPLILCHNIVFYLWKLVWPLHLSPHYGLPRPFSLAHPMILAGVIGTGVLLTLLLMSLRRTRALLTGWLIFFVILSPALGIVSVTPVIAANRYAYLPAVGLLLVLAAGLSRLSGPARGRHAVVRAAVTAAVLFAAGAESLATRDYLRHWRDTQSLYEYMLTVTPDEAILHNGLGSALALQGRADAAIAHYRRALQLAPRLALAHFNLAVTLSESPDTRDEAAEHYRRVLALEPANYEAHLNLGTLLCVQGRLEEAVAHYTRVVQIHPDCALGRYDLGKILAATDRPQEGIAQLRAALKLAPEDLRVLKDLAWLLATHPSTPVRQPQEALALAQRARTLTGGRDPEALDALAAAYAGQGRYAEAVATARQAYASAVRLRNEPLAGRLQERLQLYQWECPYYENPRVPLDRLLAQTGKKQATGSPNLQSAICNPQWEGTRREIQHDSEATPAE